MQTKMNYQISKEALKEEYARRTLSNQKMTSVPNIFNFNLKLHLFKTDTASLILIPERHQTRWIRQTHARSSERDKQATSLKLLVPFFSFLVLQIKYSLVSQSKNTFPSLHPKEDLTFTAHVPHLSNFSDRIFHRLD